MLDLRTSATEQIEWLNTGKVTSRTLTEAYLQTYQTVNKAINAVVKTDAQRALFEAEKIDKRRASGEDVGPLAGLPMTVKDSFDVNGMPAVCGSADLVDRPADVADAFVVAQLKAAGAVIWGKTNTPLFAGDAQTYNKVYGVTNNPIDHALSPAGSSGGSAAALASAITPLEIGSDIAGSVRTPAHSCGVCALKPTWGTLSTRGHVPPMPGNSAVEVDLAVAGPMARNITDLHLLFSVLAPHQPCFDAPQALSDIRVAIWHEPAFALDTHSRDARRKAAERAIAAGASVQVANPDIDPIELIDTYERLLIPIITAGLPRPIKVLFRMLEPFTSLAAKKGQISLPNMMRYAVQSGPAFADARARRSAMKRACEQFFARYDVLIAPVMPTPALPHNNKGSLYQRKIEVDGEQMPYTRIFDWIALASNCHLPAVTMPVCATPDGLPIGLQLIGKEGSDHKLLSIARLFEAELQQQSQMPIACEARISA